MGFNKRIIDKDRLISIIKGRLPFQNIDKLIKCDALMMDSWCSAFFKQYYHNYGEYEEKRKEIVEAHRLSSAPYDVKDESMFYLSNVYVNLLHSKDWLEIELTFQCLEKLYGSKINIPQEISGKYNELLDFCREKIDDYFKSSSRDFKIKDIIENQ